MWQRLMEWLPDVRWEFELGDVANLLVAIVGAVLAYLAIKLGKEQAKIATKQTEMAELQHDIMLRQIAREAELGITSFGQFTELLDPAAIHAFNGSVAPVRVLEWKL